MISVVEALFPSCPRSATETRLPPQVCQPLRVQEQSAGHGAGGVLEGFWRGSPQPTLVWGVGDYICKYQIEMQSWVTLQMGWMAPPRPQLPLTLPPQDSICQSSADRGTEESWGAGPQKG